MRPAAAADPDTLRIGTAADVTSMDPQWNNAGPNNAIALHIFESLVFMDKNARYIPGLALSGSRSMPSPGKSSCAPT